MLENFSFKVDSKPIKNNDLIIKIAFGRVLLINSRKNVDAKYAIKVAYAAPMIPNLGIKK